MLNAQSPVGACGTPPPPGADGGVGVAGGGLRTNEPSIQPTASTIRLVGSALLEKYCRHTVPSVTDSFARVKFARGTSCQALSIDVGGNGSSHGHAVTYPSPPGWSTVTVNRAAAAVFGTPPRPATRSVIV